MIRKLPRRMDSRPRPWMEAKASDCVSCGTGMSQAIEPTSLNRNGAAEMAAPTPAYVTAVKYCNDGAER